MARFSLFLTLASAMFAILVFLQLAFSFFPPAFPHILRDGYRRQSGSYLVGVGKADITG